MGFLSGFLPAIIPQGDKLNEKEETVKKNKKFMFRWKCFLEHRNFNGKYPLSRSKLLLNNKGSGILAFDFNF